MGKQRDLTIFLDHVTNQQLSVGSVPRAKAQTHRAGLQTWSLCLFGALLFLIFSCFKPHTPLWSVMKHSSELRSVLCWCSCYDVAGVSPTHSSADTFTPHSRKHELHPLIWFREFSPFKYKILCKPLLSSPLCRDSPPTKQTCTCYEASPRPHGSLKCFHL